MIPGPSCRGVLTGLPYTTSGFSDSSIPKESGAPVVLLRSELRVTSSIGRSWKGSTRLGVGARGFGGQIEGMERGRPGAEATW